MSNLSGVLIRLKWLIAGPEMRELERRRVTWEQYRRWLAEFPQVAMALDNMKAEIDGAGLDACHPPSTDGPWTVEGLRDRMRQLQSTGH
ncbi:hypothetical protein [Herbaspirillum chlorophenolicum]|uniref:hypothetical protein n=1 Tax=Herbaspirillum chlorophenolicum TaxID=211589 RepID=UPI000773FE07|nr:hypothetical protein [Herbaspirillum chlorophenolicum]